MDRGSCRAAGLKQRVGFSRRLDWFVFISFLRCLESDAARRASLEWVWARPRVRYRRERCPSAKVCCRVPGARKAAVLPGPADLRVMPKCAAPERKRVLRGLKEERVRNSPLPNPIPNPARGRTRYPISLAHFPRKKPQRGSGVSHSRGFNGKAKRLQYDFGS